MNVNAQKFQSLCELVCKSLAWSNHRTTLPQSRPFGRASSLREGAGMGCAIQPTARKAERCGRFSSPLRKLRSFYIPPFNGRHSLSHARWACQLPQRGSRGGAVPFTRVLAKIRGWRAIFIAPTKRKGFDIVPFNGVLAEIPGCGRFSSPPRKKRRDIPPLFGR